jgi:hypothetical protein
MGINGSTPRKDPLSSGPHGRKMHKPNCSLLVISSEAGGGGGFEASFLYTGTRDYTAFVAMGDALKW